MLWNQYESVVFSRGDMGTKMAGFNLINTIVNKEWNLLYNNTKEKLKELHKDGYSITLFLNKKTCTQEFKDNIEKLERVLGIPLNIYISLKEDKYCKPMSGLWELCGGNSGFMCGDCAGRKYKRRDSDYNSNDLYFAHNIKIPYIYPEDLFQQPKRSFTIKEYPFIPTPMPTAFPWDLFKKETKNARPSTNRRHIVIIQGCITFLKAILVDVIYTSSYNYNYLITDNIEQLKIAIEENRNIIYSHGLTKLKTLYELIPHKYDKIVFNMNITKSHALHLNEYNVQKNGGKRDAVWKYEKYYDELDIIDTPYQVTLGHLMTDIGKEYYYKYDIKRKLYG
jgi:DNA 3'-phosphatase